MGLGPALHGMGFVREDEHVLVQMTSSDLSGWGEAAAGPTPTDGPEWAAGAFDLLTRCLGPELLRGEITSGQQLQERLAKFQGNQQAKSALDCAWWDLHARQQMRPLHQTLGGRSNQVRLGVRIPAPSVEAFSLDFHACIDRLVGDIAALRRSGESPIYLELVPGWDLEVVRAVRQVHPDIALAVDGQGSFRLDQQDLLARFDDFSLEEIVQPLPAEDLVGHAMLTQALRTPIGVSSSIDSVVKARLAIDMGACQRLQISPGQVGGLTPSLEILTAARAANIFVSVSLRRYSGLGVHQALALAAQPGCSMAIDELDSFELDAAAPTSCAWSNSPRHWPLSDVYETGPAVSPTMLEQFRIGHAELRS